MEQDGGGYAGDLRDLRSGIFFAKGLDRLLVICPPG
jgi:hypothetical protein